MIDAAIKLIDSNFSSATGKKSTIKASTASGETTLRKIQMEKLFEVVALSELLSRLKLIHSNFTFQLRHDHKNGKKLVLQSAPGLADLSKSYIMVSDLPKRPEFATVWTDVEFMGLSSTIVTPPYRSGSYHEADILILSAESHKSPVSTSLRPSFKHVLLAIECKYLDVLPKSVLRTMLGLRRELSTLHNKNTTWLGKYMAGTPQQELECELPALPGSHLIFCYPDHYKSDPKLEWSAPGTKFGIEFWKL